MSRGVLCAVRGAGETDVVRGLGAPEHGVEVTRRCADLAELLAAAAAGLGTVAVLSADLPGLDREAVRHLHDSRVWVVVLVDARGGWSGDRARALGADAVVDALGAEDEVPAAVVSLLAAAQDGGRPGAGAPAAAAPVAPDVLARLGGPAAGVVDHGADGPSPAPSGSPGSLVAVWGPTGAPGRTTVALNLAAELTDLLRPTGERVLLVDADTYGGSVAQMLGLLDEAPGVAAAARAAGTGRLDAAALATLTPVLEDGLRVLTGISRPDRWPEVPAASLEVVWSAARDLAAWTVVDCGFSLEQDELLSYDTRAPRRNAATLSALAEADVVVVVGGGDPISLQRLVRGLAELGEQGVPDSRRRVVVNRVRASASGPRPADAIREALHRYAGVTDVVIVPEDRAAYDGAVLRAATLREHAPASPARRALQALAAGFLPVGAVPGAH